MLAPRESGGNGKRFDRVGAVADAYVLNVAVDPDGEVLIVLAGLSGGYHNHVKRNVPLAVGGEEKPLPGVIVQQSRLIGVGGLNRHGAAGHMKAIGVIGERIGAGGVVYVGDGFGGSLLRDGRGRVGRRGG